MQSTAIEWTEYTWNPGRGCTRVSPGCEHCYAEKIAARFSRPGLPFEGFARGGRWSGRVTLLEDKFAEPRGWRKRRVVFVNSMFDVFHESLPDAQVFRLLDAMETANAARPSPCSAMAAMKLSGSRYAGGWWTLEGSPTAGNCPLCRGAIFYVTTRGGARIRIGPGPSRCKDGVRWYQWHRIICPRKRERGLSTNNCGPLCSVPGRSAAQFLPKRASTSSCVIRR